MGIIEDAIAGYAGANTQDEKGNQPEPGEASLLTQRDALEALVADAFGSASGNSLIGQMSTAELQQQPLQEANALSPINPVTGLPSLPYALSQGQIKSPVGEGSAATGDLNARERDSGRDARMSNGVSSSTAASTGTKKHVDNSYLVQGDMTAFNNLAAGGANPAPHNGFVNEAGTITPVTEVAAPDGVLTNGLYDPPPGLIPPTQNTSYGPTKIQYYWDGGTGYTPVLSLVQADGSRTAALAYPELQAQLPNYGDTFLSEAKKGVKDVVQPIAEGMVRANMIDHGDMSVYADPTWIQEDIRRRNTPINWSQVVLAPTMMPFLEDMHNGDIRGATSAGMAFMATNVVGPAMGGAVAPRMFALDGTADEVGAMMRQAAQAPKNAGSAADHIYSGTRPVTDVFPRLNGVNPHYVENAGPGVNTNCVSCANATQARLLGHDLTAIASPSAGYANMNELLPSAPFGFGAESTVDAATSEMLARGEGATSPLVILQGKGPQHVITSTVNQGRVYFVDGQMEKIVTLKPNLTVKLGRPGF